MIINIEDCWKGAKNKHKDYFDEFVERKIDKHAGALGDPVCQFLRQHHDKIRDGSARDFVRIQRRLNALIRGESAARQKAIRECLAKVYNYEVFAKKRDDDGWCAYQLCKSTATQTCPYCNLAYGHTLIVDGKGRVRPTLDHYFDKASYPLFAISLGNLIPSCATCNSSLKHDKDFLATKHLHPFLSKEKLRIHFDVDPLEARWDATLLDQAKLKISVDSDNARARNSLKTFFLEERYNFVVDEARTIVKGILYHQKNELLEGGYQWAVRGVTAGNYRNQVLGKMICDLSREYGGIEL